MAALIHAKLQGLCKGFKKVHDGYWVQEDLSDDALIQQFSQSHRQHLPFKDEQSEQPRPDIPTRPEHPHDQPLAHLLAQRRGRQCVAPGSTCSH